MVIVYLLIAFLHGLLIGGVLTVYCTRRSMSRDASQWRQTMQGWEAVWRREGK